MKKGALRASVLCLVMITGVLLACSSETVDNQEPEQTRPEASSTNTPVVPSTPIPTSTPVPTATSVPPTPTPSPIEEPPPNRENCDRIRGTEYLSPAERQWYLENCLGVSSGGPAESEYEVGARLVIPAIGVEALVTGTDVEATGVLPDPVGYFNVVLYSFPHQPGYGGSNRVISGHVDCAKCVNGGPGAAIFWALPMLNSGAAAHYVDRDGTVSDYVVFSTFSTAPGIEWAPILADGAADMTLITCTGIFTDGEYSERYVVQLRKVD